MNDTQSIIVYGNPLEQAMWEGIAGPTLIPIIVGLAIMVLCIYATDKTLDYYRVSHFSKKRRYLSNIFVFISMLLGAGVTYLIW